MENPNFVTQAIEDEDISMRQIDTAGELNSIFSSDIEQRISDETEDPWIVYTSQFVDRRGDYIWICLKKDCDVWHLTEDGYVVKDVYEYHEEEKSYGTEIINEVCKKFGVETTKSNKTGMLKELTMRSTDENLIKDIHKIIQAIIELNQVE